MRKIISKHEEEKKKRRTQFFIGGGLIAIMLFGLLGYAFQDQNFNKNSAKNSTTITYNGISFVNQNGFWAVNYGNQRIAFTYHPSQISSADLANLTKSIDDFSNKSLYINSYDYNAESEIKMDLLPFASEVKNACLEGNNCNQSQQLPAKNCSDNFIIIQNGNESIRQEQNCIFISGQGGNLIKLVDNILFKIFGIRQ